MPTATAGIGTMLTAFASNIPGALATKYNVTAAEPFGGARADGDVSSPRRCSSSRAAAATASR